MGQRNLIGKKIGCCGALQSECTVITDFRANQLFQRNKSAESKLGVHYFEKRGKENFLFATKLVIYKDCIHN